MAKETTTRTDQADNPEVGLAIKLVSHGTTRAFCESSTANKNEKMKKKLMQNLKDTKKQYVIFE